MGHRRRYLGNKNLASSTLTALAETGQHLSPEDKRKCKDYATEVLGDANYQHWLRVFSVVRGGFCDGWIPDDYYFDHVIPRWNGEPGKTSYLKSISSSILNTELLPDLVVLINGIFSTPSGDCIVEADLEEFLFQNTDCVIYKADSSIQGRGIRVCTRENFSLSDIKAMGNGVFQDFLDQHPSLDKFAPGSISAMRMTTIKTDEGDVELRGCCVRFGREGSDYVISKDHLAVPIDLQTGELGPLAYDSHFRTCSSHPDTSERFEALIYPNFEAAKTAVLDLHRRLNHSRCVGWDVVVDSHNQPKIMEWNGFYNGLRGHEAMVGPSMTGLGWENMWKEPLSVRSYTNLT
ncbi:MAG: sugar-transfer associated ATP-grasp domain-containing protein [Pseudomonadota bacterium]